MLSVLYKFLLLFQTFTALYIFAKGATNTTTSGSEESVSDYDWTVWCKIQGNQFDCTNGNSSARKYLFYYDLKMEDCKTFYYGDCPETINKFSTLDDCHASCRGTGTQEIYYNLSAKIYCRLQPDFGGCYSYFPMWYYDMSQRICRGFSYSGCGGNMNRFPDSQSCSTTCGSALQTNSGM